MIVGWKVLGQMGLLSIHLSIALFSLRLVRIMLEVLILIIFIFFYIVAAFDLLRC